MSGSDLHGPEWALLGLDPIVVLGHLWDSSVVGLTLISKNDNFVHPSDYLCELLEYTRTELEGLTNADVTDPMDIKDDMKMSKMVSSGDIPSFVMTKRYISKTGKRIWIKLKVESITSVDGEFLAYLSQIAPAEVWSPSAPEPALPAPIPTRFAHFMQDNWKWLFPILSAAASAFALGVVKYIQLVNLLDAGAN